jgi:hypothetical protein
MSCSFEDNSSCVYSGQYINIGLLNYSDNVLNVSGEICKSNDINFCIPLLFNETSKNLYNSFPIMDSGNYNIYVNVKDIYGNIKKLSKNIIINNYNPLPPVVKTELFSGEIKGVCHSGDSVKILDLNGNVLASTICKDNNFEISLNVNDITPVYFIESNNFKNSYKLKRIIYPKKVNDSSNLVNSLSIDDLNSINNNVILVNNSYYTTENAIFIGGTTENIEDGSIIYINGIKTLVYNNKFYAVILLNQGENKIEIVNRAGNILATTNIYRVEKYFKFLKVEIPKISQSKEVQINLSGNLDVNVNLFLNGKNLGEYKFSNGFLSLNLELNKPVNYLTIIGPDGAKIDNIIYYNPNNIEVSILNNDIESKPLYLEFNINNSQLVDYSSLNFKINNVDYISSDFVINKNIFRVNLRDIPKGEYTGVLSFKDVFGKLHTYSYDINILSGKTNIESLVSLDSNCARVLGKTVYFNSKCNNFKFVLTPSKNIAFESIYLGNLRDEDYTIQADGKVFLNFNLPENNSGDIYFNYINQSHNEFKSVYKYIIVNNLSLKINYILDNLGSSSTILYMYGSSDSPIINWSSLKINNINSYNLYGNNFEAYIPINETNIFNLEVLVEDYFGNIYSKSFKINIYPINNLQLIQNNLNNSKFGLNIITYENNEGLFKIIKSLGINLDSVLLNNEVLPTYYNGVQSMRTYISDNNKNYYLNYNKVIVDTLNPEFYLIKTSDEKYNLYVSGTNSKIMSINVYDKNNTNLSYSYCDVNLPNFICLDVSNLISNGFYVKVKDDFGNEVTSYFDENSKYEDSLNNIIYNGPPKAYLFDENKYFSGSESFINGKYLDNNVKNIFVKNKETGTQTNCDFDENSFYCPINLNSYLNNYVVYIESNSGVDEVINISLININKISISNLSLSGNVNYINGIYYLNNYNTNLSFNLDNDAIVNLIINGKSLNLGHFNLGNNKVELNLKDFLNQKDKYKFNLSLSGYKDRYVEDDLSFSKTIVVFYSRLVETFVRVFLS